MVGQRDGFHSCAGEPTTNHCQVEECVLERTRSFLTEFKDVSVQFKAASPFVCIKAGGHVN